MIRLVHFRKFNFNIFGWTDTDFLLDVIFHNSDSVWIFARTSRRNTVMDDFVTVDSDVKMDCSLSWLRVIKWMFFILLQAQLKIRVAYGSSKDIAVYQAIDLQRDQIYVIGRVAKKHRKEAVVCLCSHCLSFLRTSNVTFSDLCVL